MLETPGTTAKTDNIIDKQPVDVSVASAAGIALLHSKQHLASKPLTQVLAIVLTGNTCAAGTSKTSHA